MYAIHIIVAMTREFVIGNKGHIPWHLPEDLKLFRELTINKTVLMGRNTYLSIGHPLPERNNIVISHSLQEVEGLLISNSFTEGICLARTFNKDIYCIGGAEIYRQALSIADYMHISWVDDMIQGDSFFPPFDLEGWSVTSKMSFHGFVHHTYSRENKTP